MAQKPATLSLVIAASVPPAIIASASPRWMMRMASPMALPPVAQAVTTLLFGPFAPVMIETTPEGAPPADPRADQYAHPRGVLRRDHQAGVVQSHPRRRVGELHEAVVAARLLAVHEVGVVKVRDLRGNLGVQPRRVKGRDAADPGASLHQGVPEFVDADANRANHPEPGDHYASVRASLHEVHPLAAARPRESGLLSQLMGFVC